MLLSDYFAPTQLRAVFRMILDGLIYESVIICALRRDYFWCVARRDCFDSIVCLGEPWKNHVIGQVE